MVIADSCFSGSILRGVKKVNYKKMSKQELLNRNFKKRENLNKVLFLIISKSGFKFCLVKVFSNVLISNKLIKK